MSAGWVTPVRLTSDQRDMLIRTLHSYKRTPRLREATMQELIIRRVEGVLTYFGNQDRSDKNPERADRTNESFGRVSDFSRSVNEVIHNINRLQIYERDNFDLLGIDVENLADDLNAAAQVSIRIMSGFKLGRGEHYGKPEENRSRFLASQLGEMWKCHLGMSTGAGSAFRNFLEVVCGQVGLPVLSREALDTVIGVGK